MLPCFALHKSTASIPIKSVIQGEFPAWLNQQDERSKNWLLATKFKADPGTFCFLADAQGKLEQVFLGVSHKDDFWSYGILPLVLPAGVYALDSTIVKTERAEHIAMAWGLGSYQFTVYKKQLPLTAQLELSEHSHPARIDNVVRAIYLTRDLINTPTEDMGPAELAETANKLAEEFGAQFKQIIGDDLLKEGYPLIHAVGRASVHAPRLIELRWGESRFPKVCLVGKGVCFDSGGLDIKPFDGMALMKKDMGGAAHVLGLARAIMANHLPIQLRVLIPAVENAVSGDAYHPGDILSSRKGFTVEVTNTDAEGRLILADVLTEASSEKPELIIDFATLTGAAKVALGPDIPALFSSDDELAYELMNASNRENDPMWRLPLFTGYLTELVSPIADLCNSGPGKFGGSITAALFLQQFVTPGIPWAHFDLMAYNTMPRPGRPLGGEAMGLRAVLHYLQKRFN